jgi:outer membrane protein OmpA-like peptidoglycan-associated protein
MKVRLWLPIVLTGCVLVGAVPTAHSQSIFDRIKQKAKDKVDQKEDSAADKTVNAADPTSSNSASTSSNTAASTSTSSPASTESTDATAAANAPPTIQSYQNYDFVPGETIIFADDFTTTQDGEFPDQWNLLKGQAVVNKQQGYQVFLLTDGNYAEVSPRMKTKTYLGPDFTVEFDTFGLQGAYPLHVEFDNADDSASYYVSSSEASYSANGVDLAGSLPPAIRDDLYENKWHHIALVYRKPQIKLYVDQYRVLTVPDSKFEPASVIMEGIGDQEKPIIFRNVRIADGGGMNMVGKKFTDAKIVTHGINFDIDKATLRPESMGTLNQIKSILESDPSLKFEIDGHTDNTGEAAHNLTLSQQRADAVKAQLVTMGIAGSRLTTKGFGDTKPMASNDTPEGKANNRRVEFVRVT